MTLSEHERLAVRTTPPALPTLHPGSKSTLKSPVRVAQVKKHSYTLDALRFVACFLLAVGHIAEEGSIGVFAKDVLVSGIVSAVFFVLSGFILTQTTAFWRMSWSAFAVQRFARLYPAHLVAFAVLLPFSLMGADRTPIPALLPQLMLWLTALQGVQGMGIETTAHQFNAPAWSITPLLYGSLAIPVLRRAGLGNWSRTRLLSLIATLIAVRIAFELRLPFTDIHAVLMNRHVTTLPHLLEIFCGAALGILFRTAIPARMQRLAGSDWAFLIVGTLLASIHLASISLWGFAGGYYFVHGPAMLFICLLLVTAFANTGRIESFCSAPWIKTAGDMSIYIFLFHWPLNNILCRILARLGFGDAAIGSSGLVLCASLTLTLIASRLAIPVFAAARRRLTALLDAPRPETAAAAA